MKNKNSDSDDFDFDDDEEEESDSVTNNSSKKTSIAPSFAIGSGSTKAPKGDLDVDDLITKLLSTKARNIGALDDLKEETIIQLIDKARDLFT